MLIPSLAADVPYLTSGQQIGETRQAMTKTLMKDIEKIVDKCKSWDDKYYILVHAKPYPNHPTVIKMKQLVMKQKPPMMLSCMLFSVDNREGKLMLDWSLGGDWPTWSVGGTNEPVPETVASLNELGKLYDLSKVLVY